MREKRPNDNAEVVARHCCVKSTGSTARSTARSGIPGRTAPARQARVGASSSFLLSPALRSIVQRGEVTHRQSTGEITLPSLSGHDDVLRENFPRVIGVFGKGRSAGLKLRPCVIESGNQNLYFLREEHSVGKPLDKALHRASSEWVAQAAAKRTGTVPGELRHRTRQCSGIVQANL